METSLNFLEEGEQAKVVRLTCHEELYRRLLEMGFTPNTHLYCIRWAPMGGAIEVRIRGFSLALGYSEAESIVIEKGGG
ncbi:FeoA family protein [Anaerotignum sp. MB30-C6]|uniref:FeoA family protein n=1 Tax=Anaerotignum sp. MB30-C6 TaxID=3070814 RepID=UPI0027DBF433|nr:FeoA family protein [Anaerotignum sp. MB30-C6]WMI80456.1 FeoA family protein [Anaerotignum sp. MB30-C6]